MQQAAPLVKATLADQGPLSGLFPPAAANGRVGASEVWGLVSRVIAKRRPFLWLIFGIENDSASRVLSRCLEAVIVLAKPPLGYSIFFAGPHTFTSLRIVQCGRVVQLARWQSV